jgi:hypothetical protein
MAKRSSGNQPWPEEENVDDAQVSGFQQGTAYPEIPITPDDFQQLLENPELPAENQSAPSPEQLNPHLFGEQGRIPS